MQNYLSVLLISFFEVRTASLQLPLYKAKTLLAAGIAKLRWMVHLHHVWTEPVTLTGHLCPGISTSRAGSVFAGISQLFASHINPDTKPEQHSSPTAFGHWLLNGLGGPRQLGR